MKKTISISILFYSLIFSINTKCMEAKKRELEKQFSMAYSRSDFNKMAELVNQLDINYCYKDGDNLLHAFSIGWNPKEDKKILDIVKSLIKKDIDVNHKNQWNKIPLHSAAIYNKKKLVKVFLQNEALVDSKDIPENTPLHYASEEGNNEIVRILIKNNSPIDSKNYEDKNPLQLASEKNRLSTVQTLIFLGADKEEIRNDFPRLYDLSGKIDCLFDLVQNHSKNNDNLAKISQLMKLGLPIKIQDKIGNTILHYAAQKNDLKLLVTIISYNPRLIKTKNDLKYSPIHILVLEGFYDILKSLNKINLNN